MPRLRSYRTYAWSLALSLLGSACSFDPSGGPGVGSNADGGQQTPDAAAVPDAAIPVIDAAVIDAGCQDLLPFTPSNFDGCDLAPLNPALVLDQADQVYRIDTDAETLVRPGQAAEPLIGVVIDQDGAPDLLVIATSSFAVGPTTVLGVAGSRALAIVSTGDLVVQGGISAGAVAAGDGPGGDADEACASGRGATGGVQDVDGTALEGGAGGGGGGFAQAGGNGAGVDGASDAVETQGGGAGGAAGLVPLRGGCGGGNGGFTGGGGGGGAGGGLQLVAGNALRVEGIVTARGGGGGSVGSSLSGGGGGGAGGGLLLEATTIDVSGALTANGGGGGEGSRTGGSSDPGNDGQDVQTAPAAGGSGVSNGGDGGPGGARDSEGGGAGLEGSSLVTALAGGGGGGGSAGRIHLRAASGAPTFGPESVVSPAPQ